MLLRQRDTIVLGRTRFVFAAPVLLLTIGSYVLCIGGSPGEDPVRAVPKEQITEIGGMIALRDVPPEEVEEAERLIKTALNTGPASARLFTLEILEECEHPFWMRVAASALDDPNRYVRLRAAMCFAGPGMLSESRMAKCREIVDSVTVSDASAYYRERGIGLPEHMLNLEKSLARYRLERHSVATEGKFVRAAVAVIEAATPAYYYGMDIIYTARQIARSGSLEAIDVLPRHICGDGDAERVADVICAVGVRNGWTLGELLKFLDLGNLPESDPWAVQYALARHLYARTGCVLSSEDYLYSALVDAPGVRGCE